MLNLLFTIIYLLSASYGSVSSNTVQYNEQNNDQSQIQAANEENENAPCYDDSSYVDDMYTNLPVISGEYEPVFVEE